MKKIMVF